MSSPDFSAMFAFLGAHLGPAITLLAVIVALYLGLKNYRQGIRVQYLNVILRAEEDLDVLQRIYLQKDNALLRRNYSEKFLDKSYDDDHITQYIFYELHYAYMSRLFFILNDQIGNVISKREKYKYWTSHRNFLKLLLGLQIFREVHDNANKFKDYSEGFRKEVDKIIKEIDSG